jgi:hypothetical protein
MSSSQPGRSAKGASRAAAEPMRPGVVVLPVRDVDLAKTCYQDLGWRLDADFADDGHRAVQFTPPGSNTSIIFVTGVTSDQPDSMFPITAWELESPEIAWFWWLTTASGRV